MHLCEGNLQKRMKTIKKNALMGLCNVNWLHKYSIQQKKKFACDLLVI